MDCCGKPYEDDMGNEHAECGGDEFSICPECMGKEEAYWAGYFGHGLASAPCCTLCGGRLTYAGDCPKCGDEGAVHARSLK